MGEGGEGDRKGGERGGGDRMRQETLFFGRGLASVFAICGQLAMTHLAVIGIHPRRAL